LFKNNLKFMAQEKFNVCNLVNSDGCFDLQFRKDTRYERTNAPTYYRWKAQFVVTAPKTNVKILEKIKNNIGCGDVTVSANQARFAVQKIDDIIEFVVPYFRKNCLGGNKKKDFELWAKGVQIIKNNKGKYLVSWKRSDIHSLLEIHKSSAKYKNNPRAPKWMEMARTLAKSA
jgi:hypothetical protein